MSWWSDIQDEYEALASGNWAASRVVAQKGVQDMIQQATTSWNDMSPEQRIAMIQGSQQQEPEKSWIDAVPGVGAVKMAIQTPLNEAGLTGVNWAYDNIVSQPISTGNLLTNPDTWDGDSIANTVKKAWKKADDISPAQAALGGLQGDLLKGLADIQVTDTEKFIQDHAAFLEDDFDVTDEDDREVAFEEQVIGKITSGVADTAISFVADPFIIGSVAVKAGRIAKLARPTADEKYIPKLLGELDEYDAWKMAGGAGNAPNGMGQVVENVVGMNARQIRKYMQTAGSRSNDPELVAQVLGSTTDPATTSDVFRVMFGDANAIDRLRVERADLAAMMQRNRDARERLTSGVEAGKNDYWEGQNFFELDDAAIARTDDEYKALIEHDEFLSNLAPDAADKGAVLKGAMLGSKEATAAKWAWVERSRANRAIRQESAEVGGLRYETYQANRFSRAIITIRQRGHDTWRATPSGYVNTKGIPSATSADEIVAAMKDVRAYDEMGELGVARRREMIDKYLGAFSGSGADVDRVRLVEQIEREVAEDIIKAHGLDDVYSAAHIDEIMASYSARRDKLVQHVREKGYWVDPEGNFVQSPVIDTQIANGVPMLNFREFENAVKRIKSSGGIPTHGSIKDAMIHFNANAQQLWRPAVLLRFPAYSIRNVGESTVRAWTFLDSVTEMYSGNMGEATRNFGTNLRRRGKMVAANVDPAIRDRMWAEGYRAKKFPKRGDYLQWQQHKVAKLQEQSERIGKTIADTEKERDRLKGMLSKNRDDLGELHPDDRAALFDRVAEMNERLDNAYAAQYRLNEKIWADAQDLGDEARKWSLLTERARSGEGYDEVLGYKLPQPFNPDFEINRAARGNASSDTKWAMIQNGSTEVDELNLMNSDWGEAIVKPGDPHYFVETAEVLNRQVRNSETFRRWLLREESGDGTKGVVKWLMGRDPEAVKVRKFFHIDDKETALAHLEQMDDLIRGTFPDDDLLRYALDNEVDAAYLRQWASTHEGLLRPVHGRQLGLASGASGFMDIYRRTINKAFRLVGSLPEDTLIREPFYRARFTAYRDTYVRQAIGEGKEISVGEMNRMLAGAHKRALIDLKKNIYTVERYSNFARTMENFLPFIQATENTARTWGRLWTNNPKSLAIMYWAWNAPNRAGMVYDAETGLQIEGWTGDAQGKDQVIVGSFPDWFVKGIDKVLPGSTGGLNDFKISKQSINVIMQTPGPGPLVTFPANYLADARPPTNWFEEKLYNAVLPYGPDMSKGNVATLLGGWHQRVVELLQGEDSYSLNAVAGNIARTENTKYILGLRDKPTNDEIMQKSRELVMLRAVSSFTMPFGVQFTSEYEPFRQEYRRLVDEHGFIKGEQIFYELYGDDFVFWTEGTSKSNANMNPVNAAAKFYEGHGDLVDQLMEANGVEHGAQFIQFVTNSKEQADDDFSQGVWGWQFQEAIGSGSGVRLRTQQDAEQITQAGYESMGWNAYQEVTNDLNLEAQARGLESMMDDPELVTLRSQWVQLQRNENPAFYASYNERNDAQSEQAVRALMTVVANESFMADRGGEETYKVVQEYLDARVLMVEELAARAAAGGTANLEAATNEDVRMIWLQYGQSLTARDEMFAQWYDRYLESDPLTSVTVKDDSLEYAVGAAGR